MKFPAALLIAALLFMLLLLTCCLTGGPSTGPEAAHQGTDHDLLFGDRKKIEDDGQVPEPPSASPKTPVRFIAQTGHSAAITDLGLSPDGKFLITSDRKGAVKLWNTTAQKEMRTLCPPDGSVKTIEFSPVGTSAASGNENGQVVYWDFAEEREIFRFYAHKGRINDITFSFDGTSIFTGGEDGCVGMWDVETGALLRKFTGRNSPITSVDVSSDGKYLVAGSLDDTIMLWKIAAGKMVWHCGSVDNGYGTKLKAGKAVAFKPGGKEIITGGEFRGRLAVLDLLSGETSRLLQGDYYSDIRKLSVSPDGRYALTIDSRYGDMRLWSLFSGGMRSFPEIGRRISAVCFSPNGKSMYAATEGGSIFVIDVPGTERSESTLIGHTSPVRSVKISPDNRYILSADDGGFIKLWDLKSETAVRTMTGHAGSINSSDFSLDGKQCVSGGEDGTVRLWSIESGDELCCLKGHMGAVNAVAYSTAGGMAASAGDDGTVRLWDLGVGAELRVCRGHKGPVNAISFSPEGGKLVSGGDDGSVILWDLETYESTFIRADGDDAVVSVAFSADGGYIGAVDAYSSLSVWDAENAAALINGHWLYGAAPFILPVPDRNGKFWCGNGFYDFITQWWDRIIDGRLDEVNSASISGNGRFAVTGGPDHTVNIWRLPETKEYTLFGSAENEIETVAFSSDGSAALSAGSEGVRLWNAETGKLKGIYGQSKGPVRSAAFLPDGKHIVSAAGRSPSLILWEAESGRELVRFEENAFHIKAIKVSSDGKTICASDDRTVRVWDTWSGEELMRLDGQGKSITNLAFSPGGKRIASVEWDEIVVWDFKTGEEICRILDNADAVGAVVFSPHGKTVASGSYRRVSLHDAETGTERWRYRASEAVSGLSFAPDGEVLYAVGRLGVYALDAGTGVEIEQIPAVGLSCAAVSPKDGSILCGTGRQLEERDFHPLIKWDAVDPRRDVFKMEHEEVITCLDISSDGRYAVSGGGDGDGRVNLWYLPGETPSLLRTLGGSGFAVHACCFSGDGSRVLAAGEDGFIYVRDRESGHIEKKLEEHEGRVNALARAPGGRLFLSGGEDGKIVAWDPESGKRKLLHQWGNEITALAVSPDGKYIVCGDKSGGLLLLDSDSGEELDSVSGYGGPVVSISFSGEKNNFITARRKFGKQHSRYVSPREVEWEVGVREISNIPEIEFKTTVPTNDRGGNKHRYPAAFLPRGNMVITGDDRLTSRVTLWNADTGKKVKEYRVEHDFGDKATAIAVAPNGLLALYGDTSGRLRYLNFQQGAGGHYRTFTGRLSGCTAIAVSPDGNDILSGDGNGFVTHWNRQNGKAEYIKQVGEGRIETISFSGDGSLALINYAGVGGNESHFLFWETEEGRASTFFPTVDTEDGGTSGAVSIDGVYELNRGARYDDFGLYDICGRIGVCYFKNLGYFELVRRGELYSTDRRHVLRICGTAVCLFDTGIAVSEPGEGDGTAAGQPENGLGRGEICRFRLLDFLWLTDDVRYSWAEGTYRFTVGAAGARLFSYEGEMPELIAEFGPRIMPFFGSAQEYTEFMEEANSAVTVRQDPGLKRVLVEVDLLDMENEEAAVEILELPADVKCIDVSDGRNLIAAGTEEGSLYIIDCPKKEVKKVLRPGAGRPTALRFMDGNRSLAAAFDDGTVRIIDITTGSWVAFAGNSNAGEWIIFTPDGYWDGSRGCGEVVAISGGMELWNIDQFAFWNNRPDIVLQRLGSKKREAVDYYHRQYKRRLAEAGLGGKDRPEDLHVPSVEITGAVQRGKFITLEFVLSDNREPLEYYNIFVNDVPLFANPGKKIEGDRVELKEEVELGSGGNKIEITCTNRLEAESFRAPVYASYDGYTVSDLYYIGFGVSEYADPDIPDLAFAHKDALNLAEITGQYGGSTYGSVYIRTCVDQDVSNHAIRNAVELLRKASCDDTLILFISGHGVYTDIGSYYYLPYEAELSDIPGTSAPFNFIEKILDGSPPRNKLFLMDTCASGKRREGDTGPARRNKEKDGKGITARVIPREILDSNPAPEVDGTEPFVPDQNRYIGNDLLRRSGAIVFSSCRGTELAWESPEFENGLFTEFLIRGLLGEGDRNSDGAVSTRELREYVSEAVAEETRFYIPPQHPTVDRDNLYVNFGFPVLSNMAVPE